MKKVFLPFCLVLTVALLLMSTRAMASEQKAPEVAEQYVEYLLTSNINGLNSILAESFVYVAGNGYLMDKPAFVSLFKQRKIHIKHMTMIDPILTKYGHVTVITCDMIYQGTLHITEPTSLQRVSIVIEDGEDGEKIVLYQATPVHKDAVLDEAEAKIIQSFQDGSWKAQ